MGRQHQGRSAFLPDLNWNLSVPNGVRRQLSMYAVRRSITIEELGRRILTAVAEGQLVDAVLDDKEGL